MPMPRLNQPKQITFLVSLVVVIVAIVCYFWKPNSTITDNTMWIAAVGWLILAAGNLIKGL
jgi:uncharacterized membrane protein